MQHDSRNISMLMDFYEMTMAHGYFTQHENTDRVAFDVFFRRNPDKGGFAIFGGLEQIVEYILIYTLMKVISIFYGIKESLVRNF